jgi:hypothetical protein
VFLDVAPDVAECRIKLGKCDRESHPVEEKLWKPPSCIVREIKHANIFDVLNRLVGL